MPNNNTVEIINCFFNVDYTLSCVYTLITCVDNVLTHIHKNIPTAINVNGYIKFAI
jgi:hypothetical protein